MVVALQHPIRQHDSLIPVPSCSDKALRDRHRRRLTGLLGRAALSNSVSRQAKRRCSCSNPVVQSYACRLVIASGCCLLVVHCRGIDASMWQVQPRPNPAVFKSRKDLQARVSVELHHGMSATATVCSQLRTTGTCITHCACLDVDGLSTNPSMRRVAPSPLAVPKTQLLLSRRADQQSVAAVSVIPLPGSE